MTYEIKYQDERYLLKVSESEGFDLRVYSLDHTFLCYYGNAPTWKQAERMIEDLKSMDIVDRNYIINYLAIKNSKRVFS